MQCGVELETGEFGGNMLAIAFAQEHTVTGDVGVDHTELVQVLHGECDLLHDGNGIGNADMAVLSK